MLQTASPWNCKFVRKALECAPIKKHQKHDRSKQIHLQVGSNGLLNCKEPHLSVTQLSGIIQQFKVHFKAGLCNCTDDQLSWINWCIALRFWVALNKFGDYNYDLRDETVFKRIHVKSRSNPSDWNLRLFLLTNTLIRFATAAISPTKLIFLVELAM